MKINKNFFLVLTILSATELVFNSIYNGASHRLFWMEANIWLYRLVKVLFICLFLKGYFDARNKEKRIQQ
jgi:hypothetical protein